MLLNKLLKENKMGRVKIGKKELWRAIRNQCLDCVYGVSKEVELCADPYCRLYPYRFGRVLKEGDTIYDYEKCLLIFIQMRSKEFLDHINR